MKKYRKLLSGGKEWDESVAGILGKKYQKHFGVNARGEPVLRLYDEGPEIVLPRQVARRIKLALAADDAHRLHWEVSGTLREINCHKAKFFALGLIDKHVLRVPAEESARVGEMARNISSNKFERANDGNNLRTLAARTCREGELCVGQMQNSATNDVVHTFLLGKAHGQRQHDNPVFVCFEKEGYGDSNFYVYPLDTVPGMDKYLWRFIPVSEIITSHNKITR